MFQNFSQLPGGVRDAAGRSRAAGLHPEHGVQVRRAALVSLHPLARGVDTAADHLPLLGTEAPQSCAPAEVAGRQRASKSEESFAAAAVVEAESANVELNEPIKVE